MNIEQLKTEIKRIEGIYLAPQSFKQYKNYWLFREHSKRK